MKLCQLLNVFGVIAGLAPTLLPVAPTSAARWGFQTDKIRTRFGPRASTRRLYEGQGLSTKLAHLSVNVRGSNLWPAAPPGGQRSHLLAVNSPQQSPSETQLDGPERPSASFHGRELSPVDWLQSLSRPLTLEERFRVPAIDDVVEKHLGKYNPKVTDGSRLNPLSIVNNTEQRGGTIPFAHEMSTKLNDDSGLGAGEKNIFPSLHHSYADKKTEVTFRRSAAATTANEPKVLFAFATQQGHPSPPKNENNLFFEFSHEGRLHLSVTKDHKAKAELMPSGTGTWNYFYSEPNTTLELRSHRFREKEEIDRNFFRRPKAGFIDNALLSIEDYQRELRDLKDIDLSNRFNAPPARQIGPLCGVFLHPLFHAELRALNITSYILTNLYVSSRTRLHHLRIVFEGSSHFRPTDFTIHLPDRGFLRGKKYVLQAGDDTRNIKRVTIMDPSGNLTVSLDVSRCIIPQFLRGSAFVSLKRGIRTGSFTIYTSNLMIVSNFTYDSSCSAAYFWAGRGRNPSQGFKIPVATLGLNPLRVFHNEDVYVGLPKTYTWYDVSYVAVFCHARDQVLAYRLLPQSLWRRTILPPAITTLDVAKNLKLI